MQPLTNHVALGNLLLLPLVAHSLDNVRDPVGMEMLLGGFGERTKECPILPQTKANWERDIHIRIHAPRKQTITLLLDELLS